MNRYIDNKIDINIIGTAGLIFKKKNKCRKNQNI